MFCENCGAKLANDAKFCEKCGQMIKSDEGNHSENLNVIENKNITKFKKLSKKNISIIGMLCIVFIFGLLVVVNKKTTINVSDYVKIEFSGYDTIGTAKVQIDYDAFEKDYADKLKYYGKDKLEASFMEPYEIFIDKCISGNLDKMENLKNGDTVVYKWTCDEKVAKEVFKVKLKLDDLKFTVSGLKEVNEMDPFENIELTYSGISPMGSVKVSKKVKNNIMDDLYFDVEPSDGLSNGDKVVVSISDGWWDDIQSYYLDEYGVKFTLTSKEYTVDGLGSYITSLTQIPKESLDKMKIQSEDTLKAYVAQAWNEHESLDEMTYIGSYLLTPKNAKENYGYIYGYNSGYNNEVYLVYKIQASNNFDEADIHENFTYYYFVAFQDIITLPDGTCSIDLSSYKTPSDSFTRKVVFGSSSWDYYNFYYYGYETLDTLFNKCITAKIDEYNYETNVEEIE